MNMSKQSGNAQHEDRAAGASDGAARPFDLSELRQHATGTGASDYWRSLEELAQTEAFQRFLDKAYPEQSAEWLDPVSRRQFLRLMAASLALGGLTGCTAPPTESIIPYVRQPEEIVPGKPLFFATAMTINGFAKGLLVESHMGRPTKVEGNPSHPASVGAADAFAQASILTLYDPDRATTPTYLGRIRPWSQFLTAMQEVRDKQKQSKGQGLRILTGSISSPSVGQQLTSLLKEFPAAKWHQWEPAGRHNTRAGARLAFGAYFETQNRLVKADVVLAFDAQALGGNFAELRSVRDFAQRRRVGDGDTVMNRLYAVECAPSSLGAAADHRLRLTMSDSQRFALALAARLDVKGVQAKATLPEAQNKWLNALARDLETHRGSSLVVVGEQQPPLVHALAHAINNALGNVGETVVYTDPVEVNPVDQVASLRELTDEMDAGAVDTLLIIGGNPIYTAPADFRFLEKLEKVSLRIHLSLYNNESSARCHWHIPASHYLEAWSDTRAYDGTVTIVQPLIAPLYGGKTAHEMLATLSENPEQSSYEIVRQYWRSRYGKSAEEFERFWRQSLHEGLIEGSAFSPKQVALKLDLSRAADRQRSKGEAGPDSQETSKGQPLEILFRPDPTIFDGRFANNSWLQELPKPLTNLTWDNAALVSPATAERLGLGYSIGSKGTEAVADVIELQFQRRTIRAPVWIMPGQADDTVTVHLGYGRTRAGKVGNGLGFNAYALRTSESIWFGSGLQVRKTGERYALATTQMHHNVDGRHLIRAGTLKQYRENPEFAHKTTHGSEPPPSLYPDYGYPGYAWGMAIDLSVCIGCNACVVACQAENNIPVVGKDQVLRAREMHWLRVDSYFKGSLDDPTTYYQPVPCMHCEKAPCEVVCPVTATAHSAEGLNDMVYNRCVGTRYCSNNCPYKVRRFNFLQYSDWDISTLRAMRNPDVTVRSRGVMEKCTYCVQRINKARIEAEMENRQIADGEIVTACQQACPAQAIVFGDINDRNSAVAKLKASPRNFGLLDELLHTQPRTTYLAPLRNPNPELADS
jgi:MoCo/4Fe-4S cofactor protein with predicted Tat translocation signal